MQSGENQPLIPTPKEREGAEPLSHPSPKNDDHLPKQPPSLLLGLFDPPPVATPAPASTASLEVPRQESHGSLNETPLATKATKQLSLTDMFAPPLPPQPAASASVETPLRKGSSYLPSTKVARAKDYLYEISGENTHNHVTVPNENASYHPTETEQLLPVKFSKQGYSLSADKEPSRSPPTHASATQQHWNISNLFKVLTQVSQSICQPTTVAGAFMFLLYHVVFCLANGSAIIRPHVLESTNNQSILGIMSKMTSVGIFFSAPLYIYILGTDIPALYPSVDLFLAPFLAQAAKTIDESLYQQYLHKTESLAPYPDDVFFSTFAVLIGIGMALAGSCLLFAATFKLANLGTYLPYSVLCGFFSAVGVLMWALAFSVDTNGKTWKMVFFSSNPTLILDSLFHHIPSLCIGILMNRLGPKNPFFVILLIFATLLLFYIIMTITGTSLEQAQANRWFWSSDELLFTLQFTDVDDPNYNQEASNNVMWTLNNLLHQWTLPPAPFASLFGLISNSTNWMAVSAGLPDMMALAFLYLLRSSIHASALKKNVANLVRRVPKQQPQQKQESTKDDHVELFAPAGNGDNDDVGNSNDDDDEDGNGEFGSSHLDEGANATTLRAYNKAQALFGSVRQGVQMVNMSLADVDSLRPNTANSYQQSSSSGDPLGNGNSKEIEYDEIRAKPSKRTLEEIFQQYGICLLVVAGCSGFGCCPTVATSNTMFAIGADKAAPQYGSVLLLLIFYFTDFDMVQYIPKAAFSSLLVLGAVDTLAVWFVKPFSRSQDYAEMAVIPIIVAFSLVVGFLNAVFLGIAISMFVFVGSFFRVGVVKFNATALEIRSRIERSIAQSVWLDNNGDCIQVLVLQNYLFFGNASSILNYISTMFEDIDDETTSEEMEYSVPPKPKVVVLDLSLISGMDTSTVDIFAEIKALCKNNDCKLYLCGLSSRIKKGLALGGVKPELGARSARTVRLFPDLDTALGVAEDFILHSMDSDQDRSHSHDIRDGGDGFRQALKQIDVLHGQEFAEELMELQPYVVPMELPAGTCLFQCDGGVVEESERGLFFIESGLLRVERSSNDSMTMTRSRSSHTLNSLNPAFTLKHKHARMGTIGRRTARVKNDAGDGRIRIARIGPGWVVGTIENATGLRQPGTTMAASHCRLHHLSFEKLEALEKENPLLVLRLYKMLSHLMARKEEISIQHLSTLQTILSSPAHGKPIHRSAMKAISFA